ncbi:hypothetical protein RRF57_008643 [Xylaria bambusicola]|uniref:Uncharacterized protein n=1 Tax=Xylaria bambusicola TaxID=326684 RepID=A0AAN7V1X9_9PEZI
MFRVLRGLGQDRPTSECELQAADEPFLPAATALVPREVAGVTGSAGLGRLWAGKAGPGGYGSKSDSGGKPRPHPPPPGTMTS